MNSEDIRQSFLMETRGQTKTCEWYKQAAKIYLLASKRALWSKENLGNLQVAHGKEWSNLYKLAAIDCARRYRRLL